MSKLFHSANYHFMEGLSVSIRPNTANPETQEFCLGSAEDGLHYQKPLTLFVTREQLAEVRDAINAFLTPEPETVGWTQSDFDAGMRGFARDILDSTLKGNVDQANYLRQQRVEFEIAHPELDMVWLNRETER